MSVLQIDYYKNGQFKGASGASIFQSSNSQSSIAFKFEDDIEDAIVFANILLPYPENSQLYGQYKAQSLIMEKKVDPNGGYIYIGQLLAQYLQTNGKAYVNAQIQASEGLYKFQNDTTQPQYITLAGVVYEISTNTVTIDGHSVDLLVLTNNLTGEVYNQVNAGVITVKNVIYKITEFDAVNDILKMESGFAVDNYQRVEFKITASAPYYAAMPMTPEESMIFADAISKNQYDIVQLQQDKQDKEDPNINPDVNPGDDNDHTVVGNINTLLRDTDQNTDDIGTLQGEMSQAQQDIHDLQVLVGYGVNIVGEMTTIDALPTDAQVSAFVTSQTGEAPVRGQAVIVRVDYTAGTDTIYLYVFDGANWKHFEMQFLNDAGNGIKGLIAGNYNAGELSTPDKFMVNITNGRIVDIIRVDSVGNIVTLKDALDLIIAKVLDTSTGAVNRAKMDANGNNIANTYQTKVEGASKDYVKDYASPKALYDLNYPDYALGQFKSVEVNDTSYNKTTNSTRVGYTPLATITKSLEADILLGDQNGLVNRLWISANITEDVKLRITTAYVDGNNQTQTLSVEETDTFGLVTGIAKLLQIESVFSGLTQPITLPAGTTLIQTIEVWREASASADFTLLSNTTYNAYMTLNKIGYVRYALEQEPSAIETGHDSTPTIDSDGDLLVQSTDGKMHYANGGEQEIATILKVPMASGINQNDVRPPKAGDVYNATYDKVPYVDVTSWENPLTADQLALLQTTPAPILKRNNLWYMPTDMNPTNRIWLSIAGNTIYEYMVSGSSASIGFEARVIQTEIAPNYSIISTYAVGDVVTYNGHIYQCNTAIPTPENWNASHWTQVDVKTLLNGKQDTLTFDNTPTTGSNNPVKSSGIKQYVDDGLATKQGTLSTAQQSAVNSGIDSTKVAQITTNANNITAINNKIPSQASAQNQLADKDFVNDQINSVTAYYITYNASGDPFPTKSALTNATTFYSGGQVRVPTRNDYCYVLADETHDNATTRYSYQNTQWEFQIVVNETALTTAQLNALNSGITSSLVSQIGTNTTAIEQRFKVYNLDGGLIGTNVSNAIKTLLTTNPRPIIFFNNQYYYPSSGSGTLFYWDIDNADPSTGTLKTIYLNGNELGETTSAYPTTAQVNAKLTKDTSVTTYAQVYVKEDDGTATMYDISSGVPTSYSMAMRVGDGQIVVPQTPTADGHATSKKYVDDTIASAITTAINASY